MSHFYTKVPSQKPMLRQIKWQVQNEPIATSGVLPLIIQMSISILFVKP